MSWRAEAVHVLAWALRERPGLPPYDRQVDLRRLREFATGDLDEFVAGARLRPRREIEHARDLAELWHWRSRTRELEESGDDSENWQDIVRMTVELSKQRGDFRPIRQDFPAFRRAYRELNSEQWAQVSSITRERHFALNWLCGYAPRNRWEDTPTDT
jgi:hypothetical protein